MSKVKVSEVKFRGSWSSAQPRKRVQKFFTKPTLTKQSERDSCDINKIVDRWHKTGVLEHTARFPAGYGDFLAPPSYQEALDKVISADTMFATLPSNIRDRFNNKPTEFLAFVSDSKNTDEMVKMGLLKPGFTAGERVPNTQVSPAVSPAPANSEKKASQPAEK